MASWRGRLFVLLVVLSLGTGLWVKATDLRQEGEVTPRSVKAHVSFLAVGDVNLGRRVGQILLSGDTLYPWQAVRDSFAQYDIVLANLESNLSDQKGRTVDPKSNVVFTGPPSGARSLALAGVTIVSTANNHAMDFGVDALRETIRLLDSAGVRHVGTSAAEEDLYQPVRLSIKGMVFAFLACTDLMNGEGRSWSRYVASTDTSRLLPAIRLAKSSADVVVVSCHGGEEYADRPSPRIIHFARTVLRAGADVFLGHHPHVPYGIEVVGKGYAVYSLGNFVFRQPGNFWTEHSYAVAFDCTRDSTGVHVSFPRCLPVACGFQPRFFGSGPEADAVRERARSLPKMDRVLIEQ
jgi:poly-gamma-glutamate synthesis protein (capsule biosynthesis protein)